MGEGSSRHEFAARVNSRLQQVTAPSGIVGPPLPGMHLPPVSQVPP